MELEFPLPREQAVNVAVSLISRAVVNKLGAGPPWGLCLWVSLPASYASNQPIAGRGSKKALMDMVLLGNQLVELFFSSTLWGNQAVAASLLWSIEQ